MEGHGKLYKTAKELKEEQKQVVERLMGMKEEVEERKEIQWKRRSWRGKMDEMECLFKGGRTHTPFPQAPGKIFVCAPGLEALPVCPLRLPMKQPHSLTDPPSFITPPNTHESILPLRAHLPP